MTFRGNAPDRARDSVARDHCQKPQPDNRICDQSTGGEIRIRGNNPLIKAIYVLMELRADPTD